MSANTFDLHLPSRITVENANAVMQQLRQGIETGSNRIDLSPVRHCDSAGIAALLEAKIHANEHNCQLTLLNPLPQVEALAAFLKVDSLLFA